MRSAHQHANENIITSCQSSTDLVYFHESVDPPLGYHRRMKMLTECYPEVAAAVSEVGSCLVRRARVRV